MVSGIGEVDTGDGGGFGGWPRAEANLEDWGTLKTDGDDVQFLGGGERKKNFFLGAKLIKTSFMTMKLFF